MTGKLSRLLAQERVWAARPLADALAAGIGHRQTRRYLSERTVLNLLDRYDELLAVVLADDRRLRQVLAVQERVILAVDGLQPDVGHEVLWVVRDCLTALATDEPFAPSPRLDAVPFERTLTAAILDSRTVQSTPESGARAGYDGAKKRKGSKVHIAVGTLGNLLALTVTAASEQEQAQVAELAAAVQQVTGKQVGVAFADQGYTGERQARRRRRKGSGWRWRGTPRRRRGSSCCLGVG